MFSFQILRQTAFAQEDYSIQFSKALSREEVDGLQNVWRPAGLFITEVKVSCYLIGESGSFMKN